VCSLVAQRVGDTELAERPHDAVNLRWRKVVESGDNCFLGKAASDRQTPVPQHFRIGKGWKISFA
jgi:hypothetical protein